LVVGQVALSLVLLVAAGLIVRSLQQVRLIGPGFNPEHMVEMSFDLGLQGYDRSRGQQFQSRLLEQVRALPGVHSAALTGFVPLSLNMSTQGIFIEGQPPARGANIPEALYSWVGVGYFRTMEIPIVEGRDFSDQDREDGLRVVIVSQAFARRFWPGQSAIGKRIGNDAAGPFAEVIAVAQDSKYISLNEDPSSFVYHPLLQGYESAATLLVRAAGEPSAAIAMIRRTVQRQDPNLPVYEVKTLTEHLGFSLFPLRVGVSVVGSFGLLALILAAIGIYGVMAYAVSQRTREIGIRMALGAQAKDVLGLVVVQGMTLTLVGLALGAVGAFALTRFMSMLLYGVSATDAITFGSVTLLLTLTALIACYLPARRATKVDAMLALRHE
jgi:predicted permease